LVPDISKNGYSGKSLQKRIGSELHQAAFKVNLSTIRTSLFLFFVMYSDGSYLLFIYLSEVGVALLTHPFSRGSFERL
jgi:hypothetical protein